MQDKPTFVTKENAITAYKGFDTNLTCRGFVYKVGETSSHRGNVMVCEEGFHACFDPKDVFTFYPPAGSKFAVVKLWGNLSWGEDKVAAEHIEVAYTLSLLEFIGIVCKKVTEGAASATGDQGKVMGTNGNALFLTERDDAGVDAGVDVRLSLAFHHHLRECAGVLGQALAVLVADQLRRDASA